MSRAMRIAVAAIALLGLLGTMAHAEGGVVQGQVVNGTAGGDTALTGLPVRLYLFSGNTLKDTRRTNTDAQGVFRFEGVPTGGAWSGVATVDYAGVEYESEPLDLSASTDLNGDIVVYETTTDDAALSVEHSHLIIEMGIGQLEVTEDLILNNTGDRTYVGSEEVIPDKRATARLALPAGATDVSFNPPEVASDMVRTGQGFVDTRPVIPGRQEYMFSYALPCEGTTYNLLEPILYPTTAMNVLVNAPGAEVNAPALERLGTREASGVTYLHLAGHSLSKGSDVVLGFSGLGRPAENRVAGAQGADVVAGVVHQGWWDAIPVLATALLAAALILRLRRRAEVPWAAQRRAVSSLEAERDRMLANIADLDDRYEAGELEEDAFRRQREAEKSLLVRLLLSAQGNESESTGVDDAPTAGRRADDRSRKAVRPRGRSAQRRPKAG